MIKLTNILQSPFFLALIVTLIIIPFLPEIFDKYKTKLVDSDLLYPPNSNMKRGIYYNDFDHDGNSEKIRCQFGTNMPSFIIYDNNDGVLCQINFKKPLLEKSILFFGDYDNNGLNEIYFFTYKNDSIFIQSVEPFDGKKCTNIPKKPIFIDKVRKNDKMDIGVIWNVEMFDLDKDNYKEVIFILMTGFALQPRNLYAYNIENEIIIKSPKSGSTLQFTNIGSSLYDLDNDGKTEIICGSIAVGNFTFDFPYRDNSAWLFVFDNNLSFSLSQLNFLSLHHT